MSQSKESISQTGLSSQEVQQRLQQYGPNAVQEQHPHPIRAFLSKFWGPIPWMLELTILLQIMLGKYSSAGIIFFLLVVNGLLGFIQENRAQNALALLKQTLTVQVRALRDGRWGLVAAEALVPDDVVHLRVGDIVPADIQLFEGAITADQSALTGESTAVEIGAAGMAYAGSIVQRGEGSGTVIGTGQHTQFGKTAELVHTAKTVSHLEQIIQGIIKYLVLMSVILSAVILVYAAIHHRTLVEMLPFILILLIASIPVALPTTFTLASALGSQELASQGVLVTRLSAIQEAAAMDVLCSDKTGTITCNQLAVADCHPYSPYTQAQLLQLAALASDASTQDAIDLAILNAAQQQKIPVDFTQRTQFTPFDPATKRTEAFARVDGQTMRVVKGFPRVIISLVENAPDIEPDVQHLAQQGFRVLAVASGDTKKLYVVGLLGLQDPPRDDSKTVITRLRELGVKVLMITGDSLETAQAVGKQVGITGPAATPAAFQTAAGANQMNYEIFAGVFPEDKFRLVQMLQQGGHVVGMTGDGVNDAPALKQAEVGVAVSNATDVAKTAASMILTTPGLSNMVKAIEIGRQIYQRMLTYTLNKIVKSFQIGLFLTLGFLLTGELVTSPHLIVLLFFANDFVTMALATDHVSFSRSPDRWNIHQLTISALILALAWLVFSFATLYAGLHIMQLNLPALQTLIFLMLVFTGQANVYLARERGHFWHSQPSRWLLLSTAFDIMIVGLFAFLGILMAPIPAGLIVGLLVLTLFYMLIIDQVKVDIFQRIT